MCPAANKNANALASLLELDDAEDGASGALVVHTPALAATTKGAVAVGTVSKAGAEVIKNPFSSKCFAAVAAARGSVTTVGNPCSLYRVTTSRPPASGPTGESCGEDAGDNVGDAILGVDC